MGESAPLLAPKFFAQPAVQDKGIQIPCAERISVAAGDNQHSRLRRAFFRTAFENVCLVLFIHFSKVLVFRGEVSYLTRPEKKTEKWKMPFDKFMLY